MKNAHEMEYDFHVRVNYIKFCAVSNMSFSKAPSNGVSTTNYFFTFRFWTRTQLNRAKAWPVFFKLIIIITISRDRQTLC